MEKHYPCEVYYPINNAVGDINYLASGVNYADIFNQYPRQDIHRYRTNKQSLHSCRYNNSGEVGEDDDAGNSTNNNCGNKSFWLIKSKKINNSRSDALSELYINLTPVMPRQQKIAFHKIDLF